MGDLLAAWRSAFDERRTNDMVSLFTEDALLQGIDPRLLVGPAAISGYYDNVPHGTRATVEVLRGTWLDAGLVGGFADVTFTDAKGQSGPIRLSIVAQRVEGAWRIRQYHAAARQ